MNHSDDTATIKDIVEIIVTIEQKNDVDLYCDLMDKLYSLAETDKRYMTALVTYFATEAEKDDLWTVREVMMERWGIEVNTYFWQECWQGDHDDFTSAICACLDHFFPYN
jgi:hypothetical protein